MEFLSETEKFAAKMMVFGIISDHGTGRLDVVEVMINQTKHIELLKNPIESLWDIKRK